MEIKEVVAKLREIREKYESGQLSMAGANMIGKYYVDKFNEYSKQVAKKYKTSPKLIPNNVKFYPSK